VLRVYVWLTELLRRENGQDMIEYALIAALISIVVVVAAAGILEVAFAEWAEDTGKCLTKPGRGHCMRLVVR